MRFGLIGYGLWGRHHAASIVKAADAELAAIACGDDASFDAAKSDFPGIPVFRGYEQILSDQTIDAIDAVIPNHLHCEVAVAALDAGKHLLLEKPMALTEDECDRIIAAADRNNRVVTIGHEFRLSTQWGRIKRIIDNGDIGEPLYANVSLFRFPYRPGSGDWRYDESKVGSWTLEEPVHFFDSLMWYFEERGDPVSVQAFGSSRSGNPGMSENFTAILRWPGRLYGVVTQSLAGFEHHHVMEIVGTEGSIRTWWSGAMDRTREPEFEIKVLSKGRDTCETLVVPPSGELFELEEELKQAVAAFCEGKPIVSAAEARKRIIVCLQAERSLADGRELALSF
ncbi:MAG: Gfo/Idh/MocA family oxidoreductase [Rhodospirillales bacterium]|nr:Gfo/Idh/MocA family oxidoreductase [Rhodospirillales bacterium]